MRASRLLAILIVLQARGRVTAAHLAAEFEVSERTIYRDIDALSAAGLPVYADRGPGGGFALLDGYRTRLTGLGADEAAALALTGVPAAAQAAGLGAALRDGFGKVLVALPGEGGRQAGRAAERFHVDPADWYRAAAAAPLLPELTQAVLGQRTISIDYESWRERRSWRLDPLGLVLKAGEWYLVASGRKGVATFRIAAIDRLRVEDAIFKRPRDFELTSWWQSAQRDFEAGLFTTPAQLRASELGRERLARLSPRGQAAVAAVSGDEKGWVELTMMVEDSDHGARELLGLGAEIEVLGPGSLRNRVADLARRISLLHSQEP